LVKAVNELKSKGATVILITHRTSIIGVVDKVLVMQAGTSAAFGPRDEVLAALRRTASAQSQPVQQAA